MWPLRKETLGLLVLLLSPVLAQSPVTISVVTFTPAERFRVCCIESLDDADAALLDVLNAGGEDVRGLNATSAPQGFCVPFDYDLAPWVGQEVTLVLHLYEGQPDNDTEIMSGQVTFSVAEIAHPDSVAQVGGDAAATASLRVQDCMVGVEVAGAACQQNDTAYFIPHHVFPDPVTLCVNDTVQQCDESLPLTPFNSSGPLAVNVTRSSYTGDAISLFVSGLGYGGSEGGEVVLYLPGDPTTQLETLQCAISDPCTVDPTQLHGIADFNIVAVNLHTDVSLDRPCTDYKVESSQLTSDSIEVRWDGPASTEYNVMWKPSLGNAVTAKVSSGVDGTARKAYFVKLPSGPYSVSVEDRSAVPGENVGAYYTATIPPDTSSPVTFVKVIDETPLGTSTHSVAVQVTAPTPVTNSSEVTFAVINTAHSSEPISSVAPAEEPAFNITSETIEFRFMMAEGVLAPGAPITLLLVVRDVEYNLVGLAEGEFLIPEFVPQDVAQVGGSGAGAGVRVGPCVPGQLVDGEMCTTAGPQYFLPHPDLPRHLQLCLYTGNNSLSPQSPVEQCYNSSTQPFKGLEGVTVTLRRSEGRLQHHLDVGGLGQEGDDGEVLYYTSDTSARSPTLSQVGQCTVTNGLCSVPVNATDLQNTTTFNVLAVALDDGAGVLGSLDVQYEDYHTGLVQLSPDAVEVVWRAAEEDLYHVALTDGGAFTDTTVLCGGPGGAECKAYFVALRVTSEDPRRVASVRRDGDLAGTNVASYDTQLSWDFDAVSRLVEVEVTVEDGVARVSVCPGEVDHNTSHTTTVVDHTGHYLEGDTHQYCLSHVHLTDLDTTGQLWVLVHSHPHTLDPHVPLSTDIFLLDPSVAEDGPRVTQVGSRAVKGEWTNRYSEAVQYTLSLDQVNTTASCEAGQHCVAYLHPQSLTPGTSVQASLTEDHRGTVQLLTLDVPITSIAELLLDTPERRWDESVKVCFPRVDGAAGYELGLEQDGQHVETTHNAAVLSETSDSVCVASNNPILLGAYVDLWVLVTAYGDDDSVLAAGETTWSTIFLSEDMTVQAAVTQTDLVTSWHLLHDTASVDQFVVNLRDSSGSDTVSVTVSSTASSYRFTRTESGSFTVCVTAKKTAPVEIYSEELCSGIVTISSEDVDVPQLEVVEPLSTASDTILVTWEALNATEVSSFLVSWEEISRGAQRQLLLPPAAVARLSRGRRSLREEVPNFLLVPGTETSVEVSGLAAGENYSSCVAAVKDDVVSSQDQCSTTDLGAHEALSSPTNLEFDGTTLTWQDGGSDTHEYLVEWRPSTGDAGGRDVVADTVRVMSDLDPGMWDTEVRSVSTFSASSAAALAISISGVAIEPEQVGTRSLRVSWTEITEASAAPEKKSYLVQVYSVDGSLLQEQTLVCIAAASLDECQVMFLDLDISVDRMNTVSVAVSPNNSSTYSKIYHTYPLPEVSGVSHEVRSSREVEVRWQQMDNANFYLLNLFTDDQQTELLFSRVQTLPTRVTLRGEGLLGTTLTVQGCHDTPHCGDALLHHLNDTSDVNWLAVGLGLVAGVVLLAGVVVFARRRSRKKKQDVKKQVANQGTTNATL